MLKVIRDSMIKEHGQGLPTTLPGFTFTHICMQRKEMRREKVLSSIVLINGSSNPNHATFIYQVRQALH